MQNVGYLISLQCLITSNVHRGWGHQMETFSVLVALCAGNSPVTGEFPAQKPVTRIFEVFFDLRLNKRVSKPSRRRWFETDSVMDFDKCPIWGLGIGGHFRSTRRERLSKRCVTTPADLPGMRCCLCTMGTRSKMPLITWPGAALQKQGPSEFLFEHLRATCLVSLNSFLTHAVLKICSFGLKCWNVFLKLCWNVLICRSFRL